MKDLIWYIVFTIVGVILLGVGTLSVKTQSTGLGLGVFGVFITILLIGLFFLDRANLEWVEGFHFRVSPWKQQCLLKGNSGCSKCCKKGFHGQKRSFEYTGDRARMCGSECSAYKDPEPSCGCDSDEPSVVEGYCPTCEWGGTCSKCSECSNPKSVIATITSEGVKEGYCSSCDGVYTPAADVVEGYSGCSSCSGSGSAPIVEGYSGCSSCSGSAAS